METDEVSLLRKLMFLWNGKKLIIFAAVISGILSWIYAFNLPPVYKAECYFLPPNQDMNRISSLTGNLMNNTTAIMSERIGGVADLAGLPTTVTSGQMILGIMKRNTVLDVIIDRFSLMEVYRQEYRSRMRDKILRDILETDEDTKSGILKVSVTDENPQRAADIANAFVDTLQAKMLDLSLNEAVQRRVFFEEQLEKNREALNKAEAEMLEYQQISGSAIPETQMQERLRSITHLQQQIVAKNSEISALLTYARQDNPRVRAARSQLETLTKELERLESEQRASTPQLSVEYQRYAMNLHLATAAYEVVLKQYENAKIDEAQGFFPLQVVDHATPPDYKFKPRKAMIILVGTFLGTLMSIMFLAFREFVRSLNSRLNEYTEAYEPKPKPEHNHSYMSFVFVIFMTCAIFFLTFQSQPDTTELSMKFQSMLMSLYGEENIPLWVNSMIFLRSIAHIPLYFILSLAGFISFRLYGVRYVRSIVITLILSVCVGLCDEMIKMYIPGREFDMVDWLLDITGILSGLGTVMLVRLILSGLKHED